MSIDRFRDAYWVELVVVAMVAVVLGVAAPGLTPHTMMGAAKGADPNRHRPVKQTRQNARNGIDAYPSPGQIFLPPPKSVRTSRPLRALPSTRSNRMAPPSPVGSGTRWPPTLRSSLGPLSSRGEWPNPYHLNPQDILMIAHLVQAEAGNQPFAAQVAVAAVVLNRLHNPDFPKTVASVLFAPGQFETVSAGTYWNTPSPLAILAARAAATGWDPSHGALYFYNPSLVHNGWMDALPTTVTIGAQVFAR